jgi:phage-related protein
MEIEVIFFKQVKDFIQHLDKSERLNVYTIINLLSLSGHTLSMPDAKPIGRGLWELRISSRSAIRILYGFCGEQIILLQAFKKQHSSIRNHDFNMALKKFREYCQ